MARKSGIGEIQSAVLLTVIVLALIATFYVVAEERASTTTDELKSRMDLAKERAGELIAPGGLVCDSTNGWWFMLHNYSYDYPLKIPFDEYKEDGNRIEDTGFRYEDLNGNLIVTADRSAYTLYSETFNVRKSIVIKIPASVIPCTEEIVFVTEAGGFFKINY